MIIEGIASTMADINRSTGREEVQGRPHQNEDQISDAACLSIGTWNCIYSKKECWPWPEATRRLLRHGNLQFSGKRRFITVLTV